MQRYDKFGNGELLTEMPRSRIPDNTSTFNDNRSRAVHRWFRYTAGFSAAWVKTLLEREKAKGRTRVFDPFAGSGTVLLEAEACSFEALGTDAHPFIARVARSKLLWREQPVEFSRFALNILAQARENKKHQRLSYPGLVQRCYSEESLSQLHAIKSEWEKRADVSAVSELTWLALASILRDCASVNTAQWQYVLPNKSKSRSPSPFEAFEKKVNIMSRDMTRQQQTVDGPAAHLTWEDSRERTTVPDKWADLVITSPPYANNYDYADATRLEMSFFKEIEGWGDLQDAVRKFLVRSCTQHVAPIVEETEEMIADPMLAPIRDELGSVCKRLRVEKANHGGKKQYDTMVAAYFNDLARTWRELRRITKTGALVCFVVGDSAPYGIHVPVESWLGQLAVGNGFKSFSFEKTRDRNVKWRNRKHKVPLHEGRLWVEG